MSAPYTFFESLQETTNVPQDGILSRTLLDNESLRLVLFHFAEGQELSEHTAAMPAVIQIVSGEARITLGTAVHDAQAGAFAYMPAHLKHAIYAKTTLVMLLQLLKPTKPNG